HAHRTAWSTPAALAIVADIVRRLEGVPLAIELAAAQAETLEPWSLAEAVERFVDLESHRGADAPADGDAPWHAARRHASLRAAIGASGELLDEEEQRALRDLTAFHGGVRLDAAEIVLGASPAGRGVELVRRLRQKSLLSTSLAGDAGGDLRFDLYDIVRQ